MANFIKFLLTKPYEVGTFTTGKKRRSYSADQVQIVGVKFYVCVCLQWSPSRFCFLQCEAGKAAGTAAKL